jgi:HD-GYP domain-containing protein (c-di-GMP phosphodiesterase class II)
MGRALRLDDNTLKTLRWGALLHDIGKLALPDALLRKEGEYTPEEMEIVRQHPITAEKMIRRAESLSSGTGYPDALQGTEIPLTTHILIVANLFDAMTSDRSFRRAMSVQEALERLKSFSGTKFDRRAVLVASSTSDAAVVRGQGTASICIRN